MTRSYKDIIIDILELQGPLTCRAILEIIEKGGLKEIKSKTPINTIMGTVSTYNPKIFHTHKGHVSLTKPRYRLKTRKNKTGSWLKEMKQTHSESCKKCKSQHPNVFCELCIDSFCCDCLKVDTKLNGVFTIICGECLPFRLK